MPIYQITQLNGSNYSAVLSDKPVSIGRHPDNVIPLKDSKLSRFHCVIEPDGEGFCVRDLGSRNGTKLNGQRVMEATVAGGDIIKVGSQEFRIDTEATLKERQSAAKAAAAADGNGQPEWVTELVELIDMLPPRGGTRETVTLIDGGGKNSDVLESESDGAKAMKLLLIGASKARATDIHCEPRGESMRVRMRVDGQMVAIATLPPTVGDLLVGLVRTACQFRSTKRQAVLDGHFSATFAIPPYETRRVDYRVSFTPSVHGPKLVVRVLDQREAPKSLIEMGLPRYMSETVRELCQQDSGMLLCSGPTGSGKTTTLYNALREIDRDAKNVITIEDPVEYQLDNVTQIPVDDKADHSFGTLLKSVLRQDPDVIFVGEIRDEETAKTAMQAAMTGHLVFSTLHAKDTISSVFRLLDLKVEPYLVANSLEIIIAQRLVRVLCPNCKRSVKVTPGQSTKMGKYLENRSEVFAATGCSECLRTGYRGRQAIFEVLDFTDELRDVILSEPTIQSMRKVIDQGIFTTLLQSGWIQVARGNTSLEEVDRVARAR